MTREPLYSDDAGDPWVIPIHGIETPAMQTPSRSVPEDDASIEHLFADDELPSIEFRPHLRRTG